MTSPMSASRIAVAVSLRTTVSGSVTGLIVMTSCTVSVIGVPFGQLHTGPLRLSSRLGLAALGRRLGARFDRGLGSAHEGFGAGPVTPLDRVGRGAVLALHADDLALTR